MDAPLCNGIQSEEQQQQQPAAARSPDKLTAAEHNSRARQLQEELHNARLALRDASRVAREQAAHEMQSARREADAAVRKAEETSTEKMGKLTAGMPGLPGGMKFPF